jgi:hypothetical protein
MTADDGCAKEAAGWRRVQATALVGEAILHAMKEAALRQTV